MSGPDKASFSDAALFAGETAQFAMSRFEWGRCLVSRFTGSDSPAYEQLLWLPPWKIKAAAVSEGLGIAGDPDASGSARKWDKAAVIAVRKSMMEEVEEAQSVQALSYRSERAWHVGITATGEDILSPLDEDNLGVAVRKGPGYADFSLGIYSAERRSFLSVGSYAMKLIDEVAITELPLLYPVKLV